MSVSFSTFHTTAAAKPPSDTAPNHPLLHHPTNGEAITTTKPTAMTTAAKRILQA